MFEVAEVVPVMTNNYEESILRGAKVREFYQGRVVKLSHVFLGAMHKKKHNCKCEYKF